MSLQRHNIEIEIDNADAPIVTFVGENIFYILNWIVLDFRQLSALLATILNVMGEHQNKLAICFPLFLSTTSINHILYYLIVVGVETLDDDEAEDDDDTELEVVTLKAKRSIITWELKSLKIHLYKVFLWTLAQAAFL